MEELATLAYEASLRALDKQEEVVRELRSRTALVLATGSFSISVGGPPAVHASPAIGAAGVGAALVVVGVNLFVLLPQPRLRFAVDGQWILEEARRAAAATTYERLIYGISRAWRANNVIVLRLVSAFRWSTAALSFEITLLIAALWSTL